MIVVVSSIVDFGSDPSKLPTVSNVLTHFAPTAGKEGGLQRNEPAPIGQPAPQSLDQATPSAGPTTESAE